MDANKRERNDTETPCTQGGRNPTTPLRDTHRRSPTEFGDAQVHSPTAGIAPNSPAPDVIVATTSMTKSRKLHTTPSTPSGTWPPTFSRRAMRPDAGQLWRGALRSRIDRRGVVSTAHLNGNRHVNVNHGSAWNCLLSDAVFVAKTMRSAPMTYGIQSPRLIICLQEAVGRFS